MTLAQSIDQELTALCAYVEAKTLCRVKIIVGPDQSDPLNTRAAILLELDIDRPDRLADLRAEITRLFP